MPEPRELPEPGTRLRVRIDDLSSRGHGVGRTDGGLVVMVPWTVPGELADATVRVRHRGWVEGDLDRVAESSPARVEPPCGHFGRCGGCALQHVRPDAQRELKTERLRRLLAKLAGPGHVEIDAAVEVPPATGFRCRMEFALVAGEDGPRLGLHDNDGAVFDLRECVLPHPDVLRVARAVRDALGGGRLPLAPGDGPGRGLQRVDIRRGDGGATLAAFHARGELSADACRELAELAGRADGPDSVVLARASRPRRRERRVLIGSGVVEQTLLGLTFEVTEEAFVQTHPAGAEAIYRLALDWVDGVRGPLLDLYAGLGALALTSARAGRRVTAVETARAAVLAGRRTARRQGARLRFRRGSAAEAATALAERGETFAAAVVNPPRTGLHRSLPGRLERLGVQRLAYVSCDPATLARDLVGLAAAGLVARRVVPFDLFPHTSGLEVVALLEKSDSAPR